MTREEAYKIATREIRQTPESSYRSVYASLRGLQPAATMTIREMVTMHFIAALYSGKSLEDVEDVNAKLEEDCWLEDMVNLAIAEDRHHEESLYENYLELGETADAAAARCDAHPCSDPWRLFNKESNACRDEWSQRISKRVAELMGEPEPKFYQPPSPVAAVNPPT